MTQSPETKSGVMFYIIAVLVVSIGIWMFYAEIDQVVRAEAVVEPPERVQVVQSRYSGEVSGVYAEVGQQVQAGQVLFGLNDEDIVSRLEQSRLLIASAEAELARLILEATGKEVWTVDPAIGTEATRREQEGVFLARRMERESEDQLFKQQILRLESAIAESDARIRSAQSRLALAREEDAIFKPLVEEGIEPRVRLLELRSRIEEAESAIEVEKLAVESRRIEIKEITQRLTQAERMFQSESRQRASEVRQKLEQAIAERAALIDRLNATQLLSPISGTVSAVYPSGVGAVLQAGEVVADIVPESDSFLVKAKIQVKDISNIVPGQDARVSFTAYDFSKYGVLEGEVIKIAQNTTETERGEVFYDAWVRTTQKVFPKSGIQPRIIPGMIAQIDVLGEKRTVWEYILAPILQTTSRAMTEQ